MKRLLLPLCIGLIGFAITGSVLRWGGHVVAVAQIAVADFLMVKAGGPRLGGRPTSDDIVLVLFDSPTAQKLGYVHSYTEDVALYRQLIAANSQVVFDTRMIAAATPEAFAEFRSMLDDMLSIQSDGRLLRDAWLSADLMDSNDGRYQKLLVQNVINSHPHALPDVNSRLYPLTYFVASGPRESAPLTVCRQVWSGERVSAANVGEEMRRCGIMSLWHQYSPELVPPSDVPQSPYHLAGHDIIWYPFVSTTSLVPPAAFWISYDPLIEKYERYSYIDVLTEADSQHFADKIVLIGFSAEIDPGSDTYSVPSLAGKACAAEVVACAIQTLLDGRNMRVVPFSIKLSGLAAICIVMALIGGLAKPVPAALWSLFVICSYYVASVGLYRFGWYPDCLIAPVGAIGTGVTAGIANAWQSQRSRQRIVELFGRYVPRAVVNQMLLRPDLRQLMMGGVKREVTVMFADIRGFTDFSQDLSPEDVVSELNSLLEVMVACTFEQDGTLDKFIGDAVLILFNAPLDQPDHVQRAVQTSVNIQQRLVGHKSGLKVGIGIHRGDAVVGNIGTPQRLEYTAIGSTVNIASRLCGIAKPGEVVISEAVLSVLPSDFKTTALESVVVKGIKNPINVARVSAD